jgi:hypothetical protein
MRAGGGKSKGSSFERLICNELSKWISKGERDDLFWRSAMSGGRATVGRKKGIKRDAQAGDISAIDAEGNCLTNLFSIECKSYASLVIDTLVFPKKGGMVSFWKQCRTDAEAAMKQPMLIAKQNKFQTLIGLNRAGIAIFQIDALLPIAHFPGQDLYLFWFNHFLEASSLERVNGNKTPYIRSAPDRPSKRRVSVGAVSVDKAANKGTQSKKALLPRGFNGLQRQTLKHTDK